MRGHSQSEGATVELRQIMRSYGPVVAVRDVSLEVSASEFLTLLGPSGSGKTTSLLVVAGFETPDSGDVLIGGTRMTHVPSYLRNLGFVFQHYALFPHMTVFENLAFPLRTRNIGRAEIARRVNEVLERVQLAGHGERLPNQLSGGQQQRVALARALVFNPPVLLMDEPLGALDKKLREQMQLEIKHIQRELQITVIYVTHDQEEALTMSDRIAVMDKGEIVQIGSPEEVYERPATEFVANFIGESNFFKATARSSDGQAVAATTRSGLTLWLPHGPISAAANGSGQEVLVAIRPERVRTVALGAGSAQGDGAQWFEGIVEEVIYVGDARKYRVRLRAGGDLLTSKQVPDATLATFNAGDQVEIGWHPTDLRCVG